MQHKHLEDMIRFDLDAMRLIVEELQALQLEVNPHTASVRDKTAAGAFLAQFYMGVENILKRIVRYFDHPLPTGENWHLNLFELFCKPNSSTLPILFSDEEAKLMGPYRRFRSRINQFLSNDTT